MYKKVQICGVVLAGLLILTNIILLIQNFVPYANAQFHPNLRCASDEWGNGYYTEEPDPLGGTTYICWCDEDKTECCCGP